MGRGLQFKPSMRAHEQKLVTHDGNAVYEFLEPDDPEQSLNVRYTINPYYERTTPAAKNFVNPPLHTHYKQHESFRVTQGTLIFKLEGQELKLTKEYGVKTVEPGQRHTFRPDPVCQENVIVYITATPNNGLDERFLRNVFSYLDDCNKKDCSVSPFQLMSFLYSSEIWIALPFPGKLLNIWGGRLLTFLGGKVIGEYLLGYKSSYDEYYDPKTAKSE